MDDFPRQDRAGGRAGAARRDREDAAKGVDIARPVAVKSAEMDQRTVEPHHGAIGGTADPHRVGGDRVERRLHVGRRARYDAQDLRRSGLLFERLARFVEEPRIFQGDHRLRREIFQELDLLLGKRPHLLPVGEDRTDQRPVLAQRHHQQRADAGELHGRSRYRVVRHSRRELHQIGDMRKALPGHQPSQSAVASGSPWPAHDFRERLRRAVHGTGAKLLPVADQEAPECGAANAVRLFEDRLEDRLWIARGAVDDLQDLGDGPPLSTLRLKLLGERLEPGFDIGG